MKLAPSTIAILSILACHNTMADGYNCKSIEGFIQPSTVDPECNILRFNGSRFPDLTFLARQSDGVTPVCFTSKLTATLDNSQKLTGVAFSGLTLNGLNQLTAASAIKLSVGSVELGRIFTKDLIFDPEGATTELLSIVGGSKTLKGSRGYFEITGNTLYQNTTFSGQLCVEDD